MQRLDKPEHTIGTMFTLEASRNCHADWFFEGCLGEGVCPISTNSDPVKWQRGHKEEPDSGECHDGSMVVFILVHEVTSQADSGFEFDDVASWISFESQCPCTGDDSLASDECKCP